MTRRCLSATNRRITCRNPISLHPVDPSFHSSRSRPMLNLPRHRDSPRRSTTSHLSHQRSPLSAAQSKHRPPRSKRTKASSPASAPVSGLPSLDRKAHLQRQRHSLVQPSRQSLFLCAPNCDPVTACYPTPTHGQWHTCALYTACSTVSKADVETASCPHTHLCQHT